MHILLYFLLVTAASENIHERTPAITQKTNCSGTQEVLSHSEKRLMQRPVTTVAIDGKSAFSAQPETTLQTTILLEHTGKNRASHEKTMHHGSFLQLGFKETARQHLSPTCLRNRCACLETARPDSEGHGTIFCGRMHMDCPLNTIYRQGRRIHKYCCR